MIRRLILFASLALAAPSASQQSADIDAAARSVVRVVVVGTDEAGEDSVGMGSGVAVTPNRIVTNAHVVEAAVERGAIVGIVPSEGTRRYQGRVIAYAPAIDLAVIALDSGRIEPAAIYSGPVADGAGVAALGYPYGVDRAMASGIDEVVRPQAPIKSLGHVGGRRANARFDAVLHDANIGRGNSGGPLVDACGRVIGINSFLSVSDGIDSPFAFAISTRELLPFLVKAKVVPSIVGTPCLGNDELAAQGAAASQAEQQEAALAAQRTASDAAKASAEKQRLRDAIAAERDNGMAAAAAMLIGGALSLGGGVAVVMARRRRWGWAVAALGVALIVGAVVVFLARPKMSDAEDRYAAAHPVVAPVVPEASAGDGARICTIDLARSNVKVSKTDDVPLDWRGDGCVNGRTQYGSNSGVWSRTFVPASEATVTVQSYDPARSRYTVDRYLMGADAMDRARAIRARYKNSACTADPGQRQSVADMETAIRATLPGAPNERLVFGCRNRSGG